MLTMIVCSRYGAKYVRRALTYYSTLEYKGRIFVADSSKDEEKEEIRTIVKEFQSDLFHPILFDYPYATTRFHEKITDVVQKVRTPYVILVGVDDFFSLESLRQGMIFLQNNPDYSFVTGYCYGYTYKDNLLDFYYVGDYDNPRTIDHKDPFDRVSSFFNGFIETIHTLFRTDRFAKTLKDCLAYVNEPSSKFFINMVTISMLLKGKGKFLAAPFYWKEQQGLSHGDRYRDTWLLNGNFETSVTAMREGFTELLKELFNFSENESQNKARELTDRFVESQYNALFWVEKKISVKEVTRKIASKRLWQTMQPVRRACWNVLAYFQELKNRRRRSGWTGEHLLAHDDSTYSKEFALVKKLIFDSKLYAYKAHLEPIRIPHFQVRL